MLKWDYAGPPYPSANELGSYRYVIANSSSWLVPSLTMLAAHRQPHQTWITLIEGAAEDYFEQIAPIQNLLNASNLVISINRHTLPFWRSITSTRVENIGIPYPLDYVSAFQTPFDSRNDEVLVAPRAGAGPSAIVAQSVGGGVVYAERMARTPKSVLKTKKTGVRLRRHNMDIRREALGENGLEYRFELPLTEFYTQAGKMSFWVNLDPRHTWARFVLDGAALGMPQIATASTDHAQHLYPDTTVDTPLDLERACALAARLKTDSQFRRHVSETAARQIRNYELMQSERMLRDFIALG